MTKKPIPDPHRYDFYRFIILISDRDGEGMVQALQGECSRVEAAMIGRGGPQARVSGGGAYVARLKNVLWWFTNRCSFATQGLTEIEACRLLAKQLRVRGELPPTDET